MKMELFLVTVVNVLEVSLKNSFQKGTMLFLWNENIYEEQLGDWIVSSFVMLIFLIRKPQIEKGLYSVSDKKHVKYEF